MRIGFACYAWPGTYGEGVHATLDAARAAGLDVVQFLRPELLSAELDPRELRAVRDAGEAAGVEVEIGISALELAGDRLAEEVRARIGACLAAGWTEVSAFTKLDRRDPAEPMRGQLDRLARALVEIAPALREAGAHLNLETHEDLTSDEVLRTVERVGPDVIGVTLDTANFAVNAEDPVAATARVLSHVRQTHLEDFTHHFVPAGLRRITCPVGDGVIDWAAIVELLASLPSPPALCLELHRGQYDAEVFEPDWIAAHPDLRVAELAGAVALAVRHAERTGTAIVDRGPWPVPVGAAPHADRVGALASGAAHLAGLTGF